jgi:hypothetical protein
VPSPYRASHREHRREIARRRIDDPQNLSSGGLLLQSLLRLGDAFSHRDDRLRSEILQQRDLNAPVCRAYSSEFARLKGQ